MARIDSVVNNFLNHVTSGLSGFITAAYDASERAKKPTLLVKLLPVVELEQAFALDTEFTDQVRGLRAKFAEILQKETRMPLDRIGGLTVEVDFAWDPVAVEKRRRELAAVPVYYGYAPVYNCTVSLRLTSGEARTRTQHSS